jgi:hypothetical protein
MRTFCRSVLRSSPAVAAILLGPASCTSLASAQARGTEYKLNTPYVCPDGTSYTFTKRTGTGYAETCFYTVEHNGRLVKSAFSHCRQMTGYLRGCKLESSAAPPGPSLVEDWHSRPTNPSYPAAMPYVESVTSLVKGTRAEDTLARQLTVFTYLPQMIDHMRESSRPYGSPWTPDETRITYLYNVAAKQISDQYARTHTTEENDRFQHQEGHYELMDDQFYKQWTKALFPADFLAAYNKAAWGLLAQYKAHVHQEQQAYEQAKARRQAPAQGGTGRLPNNAGSVAARRCLEFDGSQLQCLDEGLSTGFLDFFGMSHRPLLHRTDPDGAI